MPPAQRVRLLIVSFSSVVCAVPSTEETMNAVSDKPHLPSTEILMEHCIQFATQICSVRTTCFAFSSEAIFFAT